MSAVLGGADSVTVEPFDVIFRNPGDFSERIARNQQLLLMEESHLDKVADPGAGSYYLEELTSLIAREAWKMFLEIEGEGGFLSAIRKGLIQDRISRAAARRKDEVGGRREVLLGTNQYPDFLEAKTPEYDISRLFPDTERSAGKEVTRITPSHEEEVTRITLSHEEEVSRVTPSRGAEGFEKLRMATGGAAHRPLAFMLTIGDKAMRRARAQFSSNFFACAGYEIIDNNGFDTVSEGVSAATRASADIIVVCSSDDEYAGFAPAVHKLASKKAIVVVAGNPPCMDELKKEGVEHFISIHSNVLETLQFFNRMLGIN
jgi:methylmalonyl-CoA mutase